MTLTLRGRCSGINHGLPHSTNQLVKTNDENNEKVKARGPGFGDLSAERPNNASDHRTGQLYLQPNSFKALPIASSPKGPKAQWEPPSPDAAKIDMPAGQSEAQ